MVSKPSSVNAETCRCFNDVLEQAIVLAGSWGPEILCDKDSYDEGVNGDDTGHDDGDQALSVMEETY